MLHLSGITQAIGPAMRAASVDAMRAARRAGTLVSYDTNLRLALWPLELAQETIAAALASSAGRIRDGMGMGGIPVSEGWSAHLRSCGSDPDKRGRRELSALNSLRPLLTERGGLGV